MWNIAGVTHAQEGINGTVLVAVDRQEHGMTRTSRWVQRHSLKKPMDRTYSTVGSKSGNIARKDAIWGSSESSFDRSTLISSPSLGRAGKSGISTTSVMVSVFGFVGEGGSGVESAVCAGKSGRDSRLEISVGPSISGVDKEASCASCTSSCASLRGMSEAFS